MNGRLVIRAATPGDVGEVLDFWLHHAEGTDRRDSPQVVEQLLTHDPEALLLAFQDGELAGTVIAGWDGWRAHLYRLAVREDLRGKGIGRLLVEEAEARFARSGAQRADAMVLDDNVLGQQTWPALGYVSQPEWTRWVRQL